MKTIKVEKVTFNFGAGKDQALLEKGVQLLKAISGLDPVKTTTKKRIPSWGLRPGLPVGCKITLRDQTKVQDLITRCIKARNFTLPSSSVDNFGNVSWGIPEYIDVPGLEYDPKIGILGFQLCVTLTRPGYAIRKRLPRKVVGKKHLITKDEALLFMKDTFHVTFED